MAGQTAVADSENLSIAEQLALTTGLCAQLCPEASASQQQPLLKKLQAQMSRLLTLQDLDPARPLDPASLSQLHLAHQLLSKLHSLLSFIIRTQCAYLTSLCKFSYISQRIFVYLIYQGYCGQDSQDQDEDENQAEDDKYLDGCGMGDGQGDNNVSNEIEHQEQLEGLKNYESDEEQPQQEEGQKDEQQKDSEQDNDFEMQDDFDGDLEDDDKKPPEEEKDEEDPDDELDHVSEMLDNDLWNKNMEDME